LQQQMKRSYRKKTLRKNEEERFEGAMKKKLNSRDFLKKNESAVLARHGREKFEIFYEWPIAEEGSKGRKLQV